jgi:hypothetical protein
MLSLRCLFVNWIKRRVSLELLRYSPSRNISGTTRLSSSANCWGTETAFRSILILLFCHVYYLYTKLL